jgi:hypothetical protein
MALNFANNNSLSAITAKPSGLAGGGLNLISTQTASGSANLSFTSGIDSTYKEYVFKFINIHPSANSDFAFNMSIDGGSNYNATKTTTFFNAYHYEDGSASALAYQTGDDLAQGTGYQRLFNGVGNDNDGSLSGELFLFSPANTTFVKHFMARVGGHRHSSAALDSYVAGYFNTTAAITALNFQMTSGNIDSGIIKLYGIKAS